MSAFSAFIAISPAAQSLPLALRNITFCQIGEIIDYRIARRFSYRVTAWEPPQSQPAITSARITLSRSLKKDLARLRFRPIVDLIDSTDKCINVNSESETFDCNT